jgi:acetylornithine deacetylase/succinyl-diaminopimelate desuccinylase-like protein
VAELAAQPEVRRAFAWFAAHAAELEERQLAVTRIPAPPFGEAARAAWLLARFRELGLQDVRLDEAGNVLGMRAGCQPPAAGGEPAPTGQTRSAGPADSTGRCFVALTAHMDTVFPAGTLQGTEVRREGGRLVGPGISDNGAGLTALQAVAGALRDGAICTCAPLLFVANVGEEGEGDLRGMRRLFEDPAPRWRERIAGTLVIDGGGADTLITAGLGSRRFRVTMRGPGGHSWTDFGVPNPIIMLAQAIAQFACTPVPADPKTAFNIGAIHGGTSVNSIPESASMTVDLRSASPAELDRLEKALRDALHEAESQRDSKRASLVSCAVEPIGSRPAAELAPEARILRVMKAVDAELGIKTRRLRASTDANIPFSLGAEAVAIGGGGSGGGAHTLQEWYDPADRELGLRRILLATLMLAGFAGPVSGVAVGRAM